MSFKPELSTDGGKTFDQNATAFATKEEANFAAREIFNRWFSATDWRSVESDQAVNYQVVDGLVKPIGTKENNNE